MFFFKFILIYLFSLLSVAFFTLFERKLLGLIGVRLGPYKVSYLGILQPVGDAAKLMNKEINVLSNFSFFFYYLSSFSLLFFSIMLWFLIFSEPSPINFKFSIAFFLLIISFNSIFSIFMGWSTMSKFSLLGGLRVVCQMISYEGLIFICLFFFFFFFLNYSFYFFNFSPISFCFLFAPFCFFIWIPSILAELNRTPYDFSEGESELVSGFNLEFGSSCFTFIFLSEYSNIILFSLLTSFFFFHGSFLFFFFFFFSFFMVWIRSVLPRFRFDKLMMLAWKIFIPFLTFFFLVFFIFVF